MAIRDYDLHTNFSLERNKFYVNTIRDSSKSKLYIQTENHTHTKFPLIKLGNQPLKNS